MKIDEKGYVAIMGPFVTRAEIEKTVTFNELLEAGCKIKPIRKKVQTRADRCSYRWFLLRKYSEYRNKLKVAEDRSRKNEKSK